MSHIKHCNSTVKMTVGSAKCGGRGATARRFVMSTQKENTFDGIRSECHLFIIKLQQEQIVTAQRECFCAVSVSSVDFCIYIRLQLSTLF